MKIVICLLMFFSPMLLASQNFVDAEVDDLAEKIAIKLDAKNNISSKNQRIGIILVEDFTDTEGKVSKLGASLAEEFSLALSSAAISFSVTGSQDLANQPQQRKGLNLGNVLNGAAKVADGLISDSDYTTNQKARDAIRSVDGAIDISESIKSNPGKYKNIDAVITGTLTESNDQYRILIKVISTDKNFAMITNAKGFLTKTPFILALEEERNQRNRAQQASSSNGFESIRNTSFGVMDEIVVNYTKVELLNATQIGQKIEVSLRITNIGSDIDFYLYGKSNGNKVIDANNSYDYYATQVQLGELIESRYARKTLVTNNSTSAKITYGGVAREVDKIAKVSIYCSGHGGGFWVEFRDIQIR